ncbi:MAG: nucleotidyltransferase domain-containing protein [Proteobacteria bacterium]|nr:nucleotidyltransferase domain-containing protein [Pseudomonadota bacterium]
MASYTQALEKKRFIKPPKWLTNNIQYECIMGSLAYGVSSDSSDLDLYGFCIPEKEMIFPHLSGGILGFGRQKEQFNQYQQHHIMDKSARGGKGQEYDITIYNIVKYFQLVMENNPNMIDSLFVPPTYITHTTQVGNMVRENRKIFLHKGAWHKFKGYAYSQLHKMTNKSPIGKRKEIIDKFGFDVKFGYHVVRLIQEAEQILMEHDIDLQRNNEVLKAIRRGEKTAEWIEEFFASKEKQLEDLYVKSTLPYSPNENKIKELLLNCLETHYGSLKSIINVSILNKQQNVQRE